MVMRRKGHLFIAALLTVCMGIAAPVCASQEGEAFSLEDLLSRQGTLVSATDEAVTTQELETLCKAAAGVTVGDKKMWQLTVITGQDLVQELLPRYAQEGLVTKGTAAIVVSVTSETGQKDQYEVPDQTAAMAAGMVAQQISTAATMMGLGSKVITDVIYESSYTLYNDNEPDDGHLLKEGMDWDEWRRMFAVPVENIYTLDASGEPIEVLDGSHVELDSNGYTLYDRESGEPVSKKKVNYEKEQLMTPVCVVLVGHTDEDAKKSGIRPEEIRSFYDGTTDPYEKHYGGSAE